MNNPNTDTDRRMDAMLALMLREAEEARNEREERKLRKSPLGCLFWFFTITFLIILPPLGVAILFAGILAHVYAKTRKL